MTHSPLPRRAGILLHPTSLPGDYGIGDLGASARAFVDFLGRAGMRLWQILPLVPPGAGASPYSSRSALAGNTMLVDLEGLVAEGLLLPHEVPESQGSTGPMDFEQARRIKGEALALVARRIQGSSPGDAAYRWRDEVNAFIEQNPWALEYGLFLALRRAQGDRPFWEWSPELRDREPAAMEAARRSLADDVQGEVVAQLIFERQWQALRSYANERGVQLVGDVPLYVDADSVDVWVNRQSFLVDAEGRRRVQAGVPPDPFSEVGQLWGNPIYDWAYLRETGHHFWVERMRRALAQTDWVRIDHFRGLAAYWEVPMDARDARAGRWMPGPGQALFDDLQRALGALPLIAEDLGVITPDVVALRESVGLPGMKILEFAYGEGAANPYLPHHHEPNMVVYTGTHDTNTLMGWWRESPEHVRDHVRRYFGVDGSDIAWDFIRAVLASVAGMAIVPMQDVLALGSEARMNVPGLAEGNWTWRVGRDAFRDDIAARLRALAALYDR